MDDSFRTLLERAVPRYTSYPTALQFHPAVGAECHRQWLQRVSPGSAVSIYVHIPFCRQLCWYCGCNTRIVSGDAPIRAYVDTLLAEIDLAAGLLPGRVRIGHLHFGGGTPSLLPGTEFRRVMERLRERFDPEPTAEFAIEIDPRHLDDTAVANLAEAGVNRASLGVQTFDPAVQRAIGRVQSLELTAATVDRLRDAGIGDLSFDLLYGLPLQGLPSLLESIDLAASLAPQRLSLFGYAHVPWMKRHQRRLEQYPMADAQERHAQSRAAAARLQARGYRWIGLDHFALETDPLAEAAAAGRLRRNFQGYTRDDCDVLLGFGCSSISTFPEGYLQNTPDRGRWRAAIALGRTAAVRGIALDDDDRLRRHVIERLMCDLSVDLADAASRHGVATTYFDPERAALLPLATAGLLTLDGDRVTLSDRGRPLMRVVAAAFDRYLQADGQGHARAL
jgi:oxygen-independent coproporphyrinogen III oxidase